MSFLDSQSPPRPAPSSFGTALARVGYAGKALLYLSLGLLVGQLLVGGSSQDTSTRGAIQAIARQPFGTALLIALAIGLLAYAAYRVYLSVTEQDRDLWKRGADWFRVVVYLGLAALAVREALGAGSSGGSGSSTSITATVLGWPGGTWLVAAVGAGVIVASLWLFKRAFDKSFTAEMERHRMSPEEHTIVRHAGTAGYLGRALSYGLIGGFVVYAAITHDPNKSGGLDKALREVTQTSFAAFVLVPLAIGLLAYALYAVMMALYVEA